MSKCGYTHLLEAMTAGEEPAREGELRAHARACARCHHELSWLESELRIVRYRAGREEVQQLWRGIEARSSGLRSGLGVNRMLVALAAGLLMMMGVGRFSVQRPAPGGDSLVNQGDETLQSTALESFFVSPEDPQTCSKLEPGMGFFCGSASTNGVLASR